MKKYLFLLITVIAFTSCEDVIDMEVQKGKDALVVEGWITDRPSGNFVKLYNTISYFDQPEYTPVRNAVVRVSDDAGHNETLQETEPGKYELTQLKGEEGRTYTLVVETAQGKYQATTKMQRLSWEIDSVTYEYKKKSVMTEKEGYYPKLYGKEKEGAGDFLLLKMARNGKPLKKAMELNLFNDEFFDGNYIHAAKPIIDEPFKKDDVIRYEFWSLTDDAFRFYSDLKSQLNNGGMFASPNNNTRTNFIKIQAGSMDVVGYFGASKIQVIEDSVQ